MVTPELFFKRSGKFWTLTKPKLQGLWNMIEVYIGPILLDVSAQTFKWKRNNLEFHFHSEGQNWQLRFFLLHIMIIRMNDSYSERLEFSFWSVTTISPTNKKANSGATIPFPKDILFSRILIFLQFELIAGLINSKFLRKACGQACFMKSLKTTENSITIQNSYLRPILVGAHDFIYILLFVKHWTQVNDKENKGK